MQQSADSDDAGTHFAFGDDVWEFGDMAYIFEAVVSAYEHVQTVVRIFHDARSDLCSQALEIPYVNIDVRNNGDWKDYPFVEHLSSEERVGDKNEEGS